MMRHAVLCARLQEAGFDPAMFSQADLTLISRAARELPPLPAPPMLLSPSCACSDVQALLGEIEHAAQRVLDELDGTALLFSFTPGEQVKRLYEPCMAVSEALPGWLHRAEAVCTAAETGCQQSASSMEAGLAAMRRLVCLHAAAVIAKHAEADTYAAALHNLEEKLAKVDAALNETDEAIAALDRMFGTLIPDLLAAIIPLFEENAAEFSPGTCRQAALALRKSVQTSQNRFQGLSFFGNTLSY